MRNFQNRNLNKLNSRIGSGKRKGWSGGRRSSKERHQPYCPGEKYPRANRKIQDNFQILPILSQVLKFQKNPKIKDSLQTKRKQQSQA